MRRVSRTWTVLAATLPAFACGGGGGGSSPDVPPSSDVPSPFDPGGPPDIPKPKAGEFGAPCGKNGDCESGMCLEMGICTKKCQDPSACPPAPEWTCAGMAGVGPICQCQKSGGEKCDGRDNDCDGFVDNAMYLCGEIKSCLNGACACPPERLCGGECVNIDTNEEHCGKCDNPCVNGNVCLGGQCGCPSTLTDCSGTCLDLSKDPANCGKCGQVCPIDAFCKTSQCACPGADGRDCEGTCRDLASDPDHCGDCTQACPLGSGCVGGKCVCLGEQGQVCGGACTDVAGDPLNCGACGHDCMGGKCKAGLCQPYALKDFGKSQWCNLAQDSTHLFAVTQTSLTNCKLVMVPKQGGASIYLASLTDVAAPGDL